jgi:hypothetical protein
MPDPAEASGLGIRRQFTAHSLPLADVKPCRHKRRQRKFKVLWRCVPKGFTDCGLEGHATGFSLRETARVSIVWR